MSLTRIGSIGINTGIAFAGVTTIVTLNTANDALSIGATVNVGSGITLGASGDIFATGVSTVTTLKVGSGVTVSSDGDIFATGVTTSTTFSGAFSGSGANITALNASNISSGTVPTARLGSGTASSSTFLRGDSTFQTVNTDLVSDTSPQLGGDLDTNDHNILLDDSHYLKCGNDTDLQIGHTGSQAIVANTTGAFTIDTPTNLQIRDNSGSEVMFKSTVNGAVELYHDNSKRIETKGAGANFYGDTGDHTVVTIYGSEGRDADLELFADDGDDNADKWRILASTDASFYLQNYTSGAWEFNLKATGNGAVELYHDNVKKLETGAGGIKLPSEAGGAQLQVGASGDFTIEHDGSNTYLKNTTGNTVIQNDAVVEITASSGGTKRFRFDSDGLKFGSDTAAANALDDYEEGTWTPVPTLTHNPGSRSITLGTSSGTYTRIGRLVHVEFRAVWTAISGSGAYNVGVNGLPFSADNTVQTSGGSGRSNTTGNMFIMENVNSSEINVIRKYNNTSPNESDDIAGFAIYNT